MRSYLCLILVALSSTQAFAEAAKGPMTALQLGAVYPDPAGILFPGLATAAGINAAALGNSKGTVIQAAYGPPMQAGDDHHYFASLATAKKGFGFGLGVDGYSSSGGGATNGVFAGIGFNLERVALGIAVREADISNSFTPSVDIGALFGEGQGVRFGFVFHNLETSPQLDLGLGWDGGKKYNLEFDVQLPPFGSGGGGLGMSLGANIFIQSFSFLFQSNYNTASGNFSHILGIAVWLNQSVNLGVQFTTPRLWTIGLTLSL
jgi:hypothetical protein